MGCTINYSGSLKQGYTPEHVFEIIEKHAGNIPCKLRKEGLKLTVVFDSGVSEDMVFDFSQGRLNDFCKWNTQNPENSISEIEKIFEMFIKMKPLFKSLTIEDDWGAFSEYSVMNKPCKITLRKLNSENELELAKRAGIILKRKTTALEKKVAKAFLQLAKHHTKPSQKIDVFNPILWHHGNLFFVKIIIEDFIKCMGYTSAKQFSWKMLQDNEDTILAFLDEFTLFFRDSPKRDTFKHYFPCFLLIIWLSRTFEYKRYGLVETVIPSQKGFLTSKLAAIFGIRSIFFNTHGGTVNTKHAEMNKFAMKYGANDFHVVSDEPIRVLEIFVSMMDYLGFKYVGPSAFNDKDVIQN